MSQAPKHSTPAPNPTQEKLDQLIQALQSLVVMEETRLTENEEKRLVQLPDYLENKQGILNQVEHLLSEGLVRELEEMVRFLAPPYARHHFRQALETIKGLLARAWDLHVKSLQQSRQHQDQFGQSLEQLQRAIAYLRTYPMQNQQAARVNIIG